MNPYGTNGKAVALTILCLWILSSGILLAIDSEGDTLLKLVRVQAGTFQMGDEIGDLHERTRPTHTVTLTYDFWIGQYNVTFSEYDLFCQETGMFEPDDEGWGRENLPVFNIEWWDAIEFCNWLSEREGFSPAYDLGGRLLDMDGKLTSDITQVEGYRLPTEAEWEYAARGGHKSEIDYLFAGSDTLEEVGWYASNSENKAHSVGQKKPNELEIYDMSGNVWEWCHDWFEEYWYRHGDTQNPIGPEDGFVRVIRGGNWGYPESFCRLAHRDYRRPSISGIVSGFRVVRTILP